MNEFLLRCNGIGTKLSLFFIGFLLAFSGWGQTVKTEFDDYPPGSTAIITGTGFQESEIVELHVHHAEGDPMGTDPDYHQPWTVTADSLGNFTTSWYVPTQEEGDAAGATLLLEAHGNMGSVAEWTFTDAANDLFSYSSNCITPKNTFCLNETICVKATLTSGNNRIVWYDPSNTIVFNTPSSSAYQSGDITSSYTPLVSGNWIVKLIKSNGQLQNSISISVNPNVTAGTVSGTSPLCIGANAIYTSTGTAGGSWSSTNPAAATVDAGTGVVTAVGAGTTDITYTVSSGCGTPPSKSSFKTLTVNPSTGVTSFSAGAETVCQDADDETYTASAANGTTTYSVLPAAAGTIGDASGVMNWNAAFSGQATITATSVGLCGTTSADRVVTVNPSTGVTSFSAGAETVCQDADDETYTASAANGTTTYSVLPAAAGTIGDASGVMNWNAAFSGQATITATSVGLCGTTSADRVVTVNPSTGVTSFSAGAETVCQDADDETYTASAANGTTTYSVLPAAAGTIGDASGVMNWNAAFSGQATITATSVGLCGTTSADRVVTVNPSTGVTSFSAGAETVCQDADDETYTASAANGTTTYSVLPAAAGTIGDASGVMNWNAAFSGQATITATSVGLCGTTSADRVVTVNPSTGVTSFSAGAETVCQDADDETYTASAANGTTTYSVLPAAAGTIGDASGVMNWNAAFSGQATITATSVGLCGTTSADRVVTVNPSTGVTSFSAGAETVCQDADDETYTASAANGTTTYSVLPAAAGTIGDASGVMNWNAAFSGQATITATSVGLCGTTSADRVVTVNPSTGVTSFSAGAETVCQDADDETYTASAANGTTTYSVLPAAAGTIGDASGVMNWNAAFSGQATITATSVGLCGTTSADRVVTVNPSTGVTSFSAGAETVCQDADDETYTASAANGTTTYSVLPAAAGTIGDASGVMNWNAAFSGQATITATSVGLCGTTSADRVVTVNPSTGVTSFSAGAETVCQDADDETYTASAANGTTTYSVLPAAAGTIGDASGVMNWNAAFSGQATITATSVGLCGTTSADRVVTVNPSTGVTSFSAGAETVCQDADDETYTASAANGTTTYSVLPAAAGTIGDASGVMNWNAAFSGQATITATSVGLCGTTSADRVVTVNPSTGVTSFSAGAETVCQDADDETYTASAANGTTTYSVLPAAAGTIGDASGVMNWNAAFSGQATITATSVGLCGTTSADRVVTVNPSTGVTSFSAGAETVCQDADDETYTASAANGTTTYSVLPAAAGTIGDASGVMNWNAAFSGQATITATSVGLCGTTSADRVVTVNPSTGVTSFSAGAETVCQDADDETYTASAANGTTTYSVLPAAAGTIGDASGVMNWNAAFSGQATITATSVGLCGTTSADRVVTVNPSTGVTSFSAGAETVCQDADDETYTASAANGTTTYSVLPAAAGTIGDASGVMNWNAAFSGQATITATSVGLCGTTSADRVVTVIPTAAITSITGGTSPLCIDETTTVTANGVVLGGGSGAWSSSDELVVTVDAAGLVTAIGSGTANIIYTISGGCNYDPVSVQQSVSVNTAPGNIVISGPSTPISINSNGTAIIDLNASFTDENIQSAIWSYSSDGLNYTDLTIETISGNTISKSLNLPTGVYSIKLRLIDFCGLLGTEIFQYVVIYDPSGGFVTGGGWIISPENPDYQYMQVEGRANFGFNAKYKTGKNNTTEVDGNTNFQFKDGDLHFKSSSHTAMSLIISGERKATYKGSGTVNGSGIYGFMVTVIDGEAPGAGQGDVDSFRIKIWNAGGVVVYDNNIPGNQTENADPSTAISGGSIVIHKPKGNSKAQEVMTKGTPVIMEDLRPEILETLAASPNPVVSYSTVRFSVKEDAVVILRLFDHSGRMIETLFQGNVKAFENYDVDLQRRNLMSGIYIVKLTTAKGHSYEKRIIIN